MAHQNDGKITLLLYDFYSIVNARREMDDVVEWAGRFGAAAPNLPAHSTTSSIPERIPTWRYS